ncbi:FAD-dependent monooxygenase [Oharaeibacter diazotrophicus]|uniref:Salicylate hydroxylase n=2 Tax=Oharaeibacter diazotrophicus TaxID=1920512 RepID=A0A4R6RJA0_9HYPH|nr:FAD-dependent monooxygenase [Oharaeibacter diazotrophicus]TDP86484.1 salicylate hydroxylase [Oharaeibacter diazotrophicus]BBE71574.1 3-hydroxybenzoate 6-hydroxylase 1 [Pleomorphomonas sp. SM30]GLS78335.1 salicylate hydroxylase [Oharaeibacter diazotrophicus]
MSEGPTVVIVGAGIAGLALALALAERGIASHLLERATRLEEVGAGLQLSPNATRVLAGLGLGPGLDAVGVRPAAIAIRDAAAGREIVRLPLGPAFEAAHGAPYVVVHRGDLQALLLDAVARRPEITLSLGAVVDRVEDGADAVAVEATIAGARRRLVADVLVGADGVWSRVRGDVLRAGGAVYSGRTAWRATLPVEALPAGGDFGSVTGLWLGAKAHLVHYPIRAGRAFNIVAAVDDTWADERWNVVGDRDDLIRHFADWPADVRRLLELPETWRKWALCAAPPTAPWVRGRIALIGDAQHGMLPFVAQGGAMAIEDAAVLARRLADTGAPVADRLAAYADDRRRRVADVVATARRNATVYHLAGLPALARNAAMRLMGPKRLLGGMEWIYGWRDAA